MYKTLNIGGQDYKLEYSIEASLYADCVSSLSGLLADIELAENENDIKKVISGISNIPQTALTMFYAGLMEAHGSHPDGDGKVPDKLTAKRLVAQYIKEHQDDEVGNFFGILELCIEQMQEDGFFKLTGMEALIDATPETKEPKKQFQKIQKVSEK